MGRSPKYSAEQYERACVLRLAGRAVSEIELDVGVPRGSLLRYFALHSVRAPEGSRTANILKAKGSGRSLTPEERSRIKELYESGVVKTTLMSEYGLTRLALNHVLHETGAKLPPALREARRANPRLSLEEVSAFAKSVGIKMLDRVYKNRRALMQWECETCYHQWRAMYGTLVSGSGCPACAGNLPKDELAFRELAEAAGLDVRSGVYVSNKSLFGVRCRKDGYEFTTSYNRLSKSSGCARCNGNEMLSIGYLQSWAQEKGGTLLSSEYNNTSELMNWQCSNGHIWTATAGNVTHNDSWCPGCARGGPSRAQREICEYVKALGLDATLDARGVLPGRLELDIYVPALKVAIEYDGLWAHSAGGFRFKRGTAAKKAALAQAAGLSYLMIYEDEWQNPQKQELLKAMIRWRLGKFAGTKLNARDLELRRLEKNQDFEQFFERNHLDGHARASYAYGLLLGDKLIACASFRTNFNGEQEVARFASDYDYNVRGVFGRLISKVEGDLVSFSNNRLSSGGVYKTLGFEEVTKSRAPSYYYTDMKVRVWRFQCRRVNDPEVLAKYPTEEAQALGGVFSLKIFGDMRPLYRIEDCGHRKWRRSASCKPI